VTRFGKCPNPNPTQTSRGWFIRSKACLSNPRSGCQHKAWGVSPRYTSGRQTKPAERATAEDTATAIRSIGSRCVLDPLATARGSLPLSPASRAQLLLSFDPGAYAPGFMLSPAPQAEKSLTSIPRNPCSPKRIMLLQCLVFFVSLCLCGE
jgi:hypothetical protein